MRLGHLAPQTLLPLLRAIADLKRVRSAQRQGTIAERFFRTAWAQIASGRAVRDVVGMTLRDALAATRLGDLDPATLTAVGVPDDQARGIWRSAAIEAAASLNSATPIWNDDESSADTAGVPGFVAKLIDQPRAGATCPGIGRLVLEPPESHADHCFAVAVFGVILAPTWNACPHTVFLAALSHHLHNALLPDAGFVGEMLLGEWLQPAMANATAQALAELSDSVRIKIEEARLILPDAETPEGRAFHAADTLDRVLQVEHHLRAAGTTMEFVLRRMELVHAGPVKPFQDAVLEAMGLAA
jgi:5'-deoxynucleotidase YfbR-like HD superfamily hydrolase